MWSPPKPESNTPIGTRFGSPEFIASGNLARSPAPSSYPTGRAPSVLLARASLPAPCLPAGGHLPPRIPPIRPPAIPPAAAPWGAPPPRYGDSEAAKIGSGMLCSQTLPGPVSEARK